jgi:hypothetical protein
MRVNVNPFKYRKKNYTSAKNGKNIPAAAFSIEILLPA